MALRCTLVRRLEIPNHGGINNIWEIPIFEQIPFLRHWKVHSGPGGQYARDMPRTIHGCYEMNQPRSGESLKYYPYRGDLAVNNVPRMTVSQMLATHYFPAMLDDDRRVNYVAEKSGRSEDDVAQELFRMRRLRLGLCQSLRNKIKGQWFRMPVATWSATEKAYMNGMLLAAQIFGMDFYSNQSLDPYIIYSPYYMLGECVDAIFNKQNRSSLNYIMVEVAVHNSIPMARLPGVKGSCKEPIEDIEPCLFEFLRMKMSIAALFAKAECYVVDHQFDKGHHYNGAIVHLRKGADPTEVLQEVITVEFDLKRAKDLLDHYYTNHVATKGFTGLKY